MGKQDDVRAESDAKPSTPIGEIATAIAREQATPKPAKPEPVSNEPIGEVASAIERNRGTRPA
jgi:hypothetical protein